MFLYISLFFRKKHLKTAIYCLWLLLIVVFRWWLVSNECLWHGKEKGPGIPTSYILIFSLRNFSINLNTGCVLWFNFWKKSIFWFISEFLSNCWTKLLLCTMVLSLLQFSKHLNLPVRIKSLNLPVRIKSLNLPVRIKSLNLPVRIKSLNLFLYNGSS